MSDRLSLIGEDELYQIRELYRVERDRRVKDRPVDFFPWHKIQKWVLNSGKEVDGEIRMMFIAGGNRGGKSKVAMGLISEVLRRTSPLNDQFLTTDRYTGKIVKKGRSDPLTIWVVPPTLEKARNDWLMPQDQMGLEYWVGSLFVDIRRTPDLVIFSRPPGLKEEEISSTKGDFDLKRCDKILIKSQDQALETFESSEVDLVVFDEEVADQQIWNSCRMRVGTTHGTLIMAYTPLRGLSWSYKSYWKPYIKDKKAKKVRDRCWVYNPTKSGEEGPANIVLAQMGSADNPRARSYAIEIEADPGMSDAEKSSRLYGEYGFVEGALLKPLVGMDLTAPLEQHQIYVLDELPKKLSYWFLVSDPNKSYGATLAVKDYDGNLIFVAEHLEESWPDFQHAEAFKQMEKMYVTGPIMRFADPGSAGAQSIVNMNALGIPFDTLPKGAGSVSASVKKLRGLAFVDPMHRHPVTKEKGAPRLYFYRPGLLSGDKSESELVVQLGQARQTSNENAPPDTPHKDIRSKLDLFDCARYTASVMTDMPYGLDVEEDRKFTPEDVYRAPPLVEESAGDVEFWLPEYQFD